MLPVQRQRALQKLFVFKGRHTVYTNCLPLRKSKCCKGGHNDEPTSQPSPQDRAPSPNPSYKQKENENEATEPSLNERFPNNKAMPMASDQLELDNQEMQHSPNSSMVSKHSENILDGSMDGQSQLNHPLTSSTLHSCSAPPRNTTSDDSTPQLPPFTTMPPPTFAWSETMQGADFIQAISAAYVEVVHWRHNLFLTPSGKTGKQFTSELAKLFRAYGEVSALESIALKASMVIPALLLQKPHPASKSREHVACLQRRIQLWQKGDINNLIIEGRTIQQRLKKIGTRIGSDKEQQSVRRFTKLMLQGKVKAALRTLTDEANGGPLPMDAQVITEGQPSATVREELLKKHPAGQPAYPEILLPLTTPATHPVVFDCLDGGVIWSAALRTQGSAGPSGVDAVGWRRLCTSFQNASSELCNSLAMVARKLCTTYVDPQSVAPLTASRLIALDKCPGIRPIGIGETVRRIIGKAVLAVIKYDILDAAGALQLCAGRRPAAKLPPTQCATPSSTTTHKLCY